MTTEHHVADYSVRRGNRYRYYISSALLHDRRPDAGSRARVNADMCSGNKPA